MSHKIRLSPSILEQINKHEFLVLAYFSINLPKTFPEMNESLKVGRDRLIECISSLKEKGFLVGKSTQPDTVKLLPTALPIEEDEICYLPVWVLLDKKTGAADKQLLCYYLREKKKYQGTLSALAKGVGLKHRNANNSLHRLIQARIIKREQLGHKICLTVLDQPKKGFLGLIFD